MYKIEFNFKEEERRTWPIPWEATLDPFAKVTRWGNLGGKIDENKELLPKIWSETPESIIHGFWPSTNWEIQALETLGPEEDWAWLMVINLQILITKFSVMQFWH